MDAPPRDSDAYRTLQARSADIAKKRGLDYIFERHQLDAAIFATELGFAFLYVTAGGYASVSVILVRADKQGSAPLGYGADGAPFGIMFVVKPSKRRSSSVSCKLFLTALVLVLIS